jgi:5'-3' exonuclease
MYYEMDKPTLEDAIYGIDQRIATMLSECNTSKFVGFLTEGRCFRYEVADNYKGNRKGRAKPPVFYALREHLKQKYNMWGMKELEADDLVSYYSYTDNRSTIICSPDKDVLYQCVGMHYNYGKAEFLHTSPDEALKFLWKQVLMGDSTDNIADNWLKERTKDYEAFALKKFVEKFGMVEGVMKFHETFRLVYLLKTEEDVRREAGRSLLPLQLTQLIEEEEPW